MDLLLRSSGVDVVGAVDVAEPVDLTNARLDDSIGDGKSAVFPGVVSVLPFLEPAGDVNVSGLFVAERGRGSAGRSMTLNRPCLLATCRSRSSTVLNPKVPHTSHWMTSNWNKKYTILKIAN